MTTYTEVARTQTTLALDINVEQIWQKHMEILLEQSPNNVKQFSINMDNSYKDTTQWMWNAENVVFGNTLEASQRQSVDSDVALQPPAAISCDAEQNVCRSMRAQRILCRSRDLQSPNKICDLKLTVHRNDTDLQ